MKKLFTTVLFLVFLAAGCAVAPMAEHQHFIKSDNIPLPDPQKSTVYFYRPYKFAGGAVSYFIYDDEKRIGALRNGGYFVYSAEPGSRLFWAETEKVSSVTMDCDPGRSYYVEGGISMGFQAGNPELSMVPEVIGEKRAAGLQYYEFDFTKEKEAVDW